MRRCLTQTLVSTLTYRVCLQNDDAGKFAAPMLVLGKPSVSTLGLDHALGLNFKALGEGLKRGVSEMEMEFLKGSEEDQANFEYCLNGTAGHKIPKHVQKQIERGSYHGGSLTAEEFDAGHRGMTLDDFRNLPEAQTAQLVEPEVLALRLYTTSSYPCFNKHLRKGTKPNPFAISVKFLAEALKKLRTVKASSADGNFTKVPLLPIPPLHAPSPQPLVSPGCLPLVSAAVPRHRRGSSTQHHRVARHPCFVAIDPRCTRQVTELWRGIRNKSLNFEQFCREGGTEMAPMSTTVEKQVALNYANSENPLVFRIKARAMSAGVDIQPFSVYPKEAEVLYPPLSFLQVLSVTSSSSHPSSVLILAVPWLCAGHDGRGRDAFASRGRGFWRKACDNLHCRTPD